MDVFFVADDFTGGVDVLLQAARCGEPATMFLSEESFLAADRDELENCTGVATTFRRAAPEEVGGSLRRILDRGLTQGPRVVQFKICSTADSSPTRGSIRPAFEQFLERGAEQIALWAAQPALRRYTTFAHHFANDRGTVYRLDRQPTMANHPSTPMTESDLRLHFGEQIGEPVGSVTLEDLSGQEELRAAWVREARAGHRLVVLDVVRHGDLLAHGAFLTSSRETGAPPKGETPAYVIGSGGATLGLGMGLGWQEDVSHQVPAPPAAGPVLVVAGSCSELTAAQVARVADRADWSVLPWAPGEDEVEEVAADVRKLLRAGQHVLVHSGGAVSGGHHARAELGMVVPRGLAQIVSTSLGDFSRLIVAGGDTSGDVLTLLGATRLTTIAVLDRDTCLCVVDGVGGEAVEVVLKGGQIGSVDFFVRAALGEEDNSNGDG